MGRTPESTKGSTDWAKMESFQPERLERYLERHGQNLERGLKLPSVRDELLELTKRLAKLIESKIEPLVASREVPNSVTIDAFRADIKGSSESAKLLCRKFKSDYNSYGNSDDDTAVIEMAPILDLLLRIEDIVAMFDDLLSESSAKQIRDHWSYCKKSLSNTLRELKADRGS